MPLDTGGFYGVDDPRDDPQYDEGLPFRCKGCGHQRCICHELEEEADPTVAIPVTTMRELVEGRVAA